MIQCAIGHARVISKITARQVEYGDVEFNSVISRFGCSYVVSWSVIKEQKTKNFLEHLIRDHDGADNHANAQKYRFLRP